MVNIQRTRITSIRCTLDKWEKAVETTLGQVKALREEQPQASVAAFKGAFKLRPKDAQEPAHKEQSRNIPEIRSEEHTSELQSLP